MDLKEVDILGPEIGDHWYYSSKARAMTRLLGDFRPSKVLDVGAGSGFFSRYLLAETAAREAWCVDTSYDADRDEAVNGRAIHFRRSIGANDADLVLLMDVLEHVDDDLGLLNQYAALVEPGCRFLITVPAFEFLWSGHDDFLEHRRRYTLAQLEGVVREASLSIRRGAYYFGFVFPIAATLRLAQRGTNAAPRSDMRRHHPVVNTALKALCTAELPLMPFNRVAGLSVFCLAEKA